MIIAALLELIFAAFKLIFGILPSLPPVAFLQTILTFVNDILSQGIGLLCFFVRPATLTTGLSLFLIIFTFEHSYHFVMWVLRKIPFLGIE